MTARELPRLVRHLIQCGNCGGVLDMPGDGGFAVCPCGETEVDAAPWNIEVAFGAKGFKVIEP